MIVNYKASRLYDGRDTVIRDAVVSIDGEHIIYVGPSKDAPAASETKDFGDATITPGLFDCHVHIAWSGRIGRQSELVDADGPLLATLRSTRCCRQHLASGTTTIRDMGTNDGISYALREAEKNGLILSPRVLACGPIICMTGGHCYELGGEADGIEGIMYRVRMEIKNSCDWIKVAAGGGVYGLHEAVHHAQLTVPELSAACAVAHHAEKPVSSHCYSPESIQNSLDAGVDSLEHASFLTPQLAERVSKQGVWICPTLAVYHKNLHFAKECRSPSQLVEKSMEIYENSINTMRLILENGIKFAAGTDCGGSKQEHGTVGDELCLMVAAGCTPMQALKSATGDAAVMCRVDNETGFLQKGMCADIAVFSENPLENINAVHSVRATVHRGKLYLPENLL